MIQDIKQVLSSEAKQNRNFNSTESIPNLISSNVSPSAVRRRSGGQHSKQENYLKRSSIGSQISPNFLSPQMQRQVQGHISQHSPLPPVLTKNTSLENIFERSVQRPTSDFIPDNLPILKIAEDGRAGNNSISTTPNEIFLKDNKILYATKDALIEHAIEGENSEAAEIWVYTYRSFMSAFSCIEELLSRLGKQTLSQARTRTASLLIRVVADLSPYELQNQANLADLLISVIHSLTSEGDITLASKLRKVFIDSIKTLINFPINNVIDNNTLTMKRRSRELISSGSLGSDYLTPDSSQSLNSPSTFQVAQKQASKLFSLSTENLAHELTMVQQELFSRIEIGELLARADKPSEKDQYPRFTEFVDQFNAISYKITAIILLQKSKSKRIKAFTIFTEMSVILKNIGNFNGMYCVFSALNSVL